MAAAERIGSIRERAGLSASEPPDRRRATLADLLSECSGHLLSLHAERQRLDRQPADPDRRRRLEQDLEDLRRTAGLLREALTGARPA